MIAKEDKVKFFINELNDISDSNIRELAKIMIENADDYFFSVPASSSGKYHPDFAREVGGLIKHTRAVVFFAECVSESFCLSTKDRDLLILSAIIHDIKKQGDGSGRHTVKEHPLYASEYLKRMVSEGSNASLISEDDLKKVCGAVEAHMGPWGAKDGLPVPSTEFEKLLQTADYIASRKEILDFKFRPTDEAPEIVVDDDPGNYIIDFGKYKGKGMTIREIHERELATSDKKSTYIEWIANLEGCSMKDAQEKSRKFLSTYKNEPPTTHSASMPMPSVSVTPSCGNIDDLPF